MTQATNALPAHVDPPPPGISEHDVTAELKALSTEGVRIQFSLDPVEALMLLAEIQLVCRHPTNKGYARKCAETIARDIQRRLSVKPALAQVCKAGWAGIS